MYIYIYIIYKTAVKAEIDTCEGNPQKPGPGERESGSAES